MVLVIDLILSQLVVSILVNLLTSLVDIIICIYEYFIILYHKVFNYIDSTRSNGYFVTSRSEKFKKNAYRLDRL